MAEEQIEFKLSDEEVAELNKRAIILSSKDYSIIENIVKRVIADTFEYYFITLPNQIRSQNETKKEPNKKLVL